MMKKYSNKIYLYLICLAIFFFYLAYNTPLTGDDWTWGTDRGILRLENYFDGYNGRYISNIMEIILTRSDWLRYFVVAFFSTSIVYLIGKLYDEKDRAFYMLLGFILLLLMPVNMFSQTFAWTAGFVNYVISLVVLTMYLVITKNIYENDEPSYPKRMWILLIPLGISTQLLVEHISLFAMVIGFYVIAFVFIKFKKFYLEHIVYFVSLVIGSIIMFSNKTYLNVILGKDDYRSLKDEDLEVGIFQKIYDAYTGKMHEYMFFDSININVFIGIMSLVIILSVSKRNILSSIVKSVLSLTIVASIFYLMFAKSALGADYLHDSTADFEALISLLFFCSVLVTVILFVKEYNAKARLILYFSGVVLLTAPFVFITPYGPRAALAPYFFLVLIGIELFKYNSKQRNWKCELTSKALLIISVVIIAFYSVIFTQIGKANRERLVHLEQEVAKESEYIELAELPHSQFLWMSSTKRDHFKKMFKRYYGVPQETEIKFVPNEK